MMRARATQFWRSRQERRRPAAFVSALVVYLIVILVSAPEAQQPGYSTAVNGSAPSAIAPIRDASAGSGIDLLVGRSTVLNVGATIARVSLTVPDIADALVTSPSQLLIHGKQPGTISLFIWEKGGAIKTFEVRVRRDLDALKDQFKQLFPAESINVIGSGKDVVLSGTVQSKYVVEKAADVASGYVDKKENVVNLLKQQEGVASNQVMLRVRFAEVGRSAMQELGASLFANGFKQDWFGRTSPGGTSGPDFDSEKGLVFSDFLNLFVFNSKENLGAVVRALSNKGLFQSLAEPNLIATDGKEASFLAGGEYPYPVVQAGSNSNAVTIVFKEFGVRLNFTPTVLGGDLVRIKVRPEVSSLDFANGIVLEGFRVPALTSRRTETEVELRDGQTFAVAGLMNNTVTSTMSKIPGIGDIPILGLLFKSKAHQKNQTELVVMITPQIIKRGQPGASEGLPSLVEPYMAPPTKTFANPDPYVGSPRFPVNQPPAPRSGAEKQPAAPAARTADRAQTPAPATSTATAPRTPQTPRPAEPAAQSATPNDPPAAATTATADGVPVATKPLTPAQLRAIEAAREQEAAAERKRATDDKKASEAAAKQKAADDRQKATDAKATARKSEEDRRAAEKAAKDQAEAAKRNEDAAKKKSEADLKREKSLSDAADRLKEAQAAYQAEMDKAKESGRKN